MKPLQFDMTPLAKALKPEGERNNGTGMERPSKLKRVGSYPEHIVADGGWLSDLAQEQIHALATHVLARNSEQGLRTLAITSALASEGKTTVSLALAEKLASADKRVLLIDLDTHRATLSRSANLEEAKGALEVAQSRNGKPQKLPTYATNRRGVSIMPAGQVEDENGGVPLLEPKSVQKLVQRALDEYDIVLLDCPPLMPVADTHVLADVADSAILVVRANSTPKEVLEQAVKEYGKKKFFAAILNRARPHNIPYFREVYGYYRRPPDV